VIATWLAYHAVYISLSLKLAIYFIVPFHIEHTTMYNILDELRAAKRAKTSHQPFSALRAASAGMTATTPTPSPKSTARLQPNAATSLTSLSPVTTATMPNRGTLAFTTTTMLSVDPSLPHQGPTLDVFAGQSVRAVPSFHVGGDQGASCTDVVSPLTDQGIFHHDENVYDMPPSLPSVHTQLDIGVSQAIRERIVSGGYVDFASLLGTNSPECSEMVLILGPRGELALRPKFPKNKITSIYQWTDAFLIYSSVFLSAHPHRTQELLKYAKDIRLGAKKYDGAGWIEYDQQFRLRLARDPSNISFANIDCELWILCMSSPVQSIPVLQSKCLNYNNGLQCTRIPCVYLHKCLNCNLDHPSRSCWRSDQNALPRHVRGVAYRPRFVAPQQSPRPYSSSRFHTFRPRY